MALRLITDDLRMAGFYARNVDATSFNETYTTANISSLANDCGPTPPNPPRGDEPAHPWAIDLLTPVLFDSALTSASVNQAFGCIDPLNFRPGSLNLNPGSSPVLAVRGALGALVKDDGKPWYSEQQADWRRRVLRRPTTRTAVDAGRANRTAALSVAGANYDPLKAPRRAKQRGPDLRVPHPRLLHPELQPLQQRRRLRPGRRRRRRPAHSHPGALPVAAGPGRWRPVHEEPGAAGGRRGGAQHHVRRGRHRPGHPQPGPDPGSHL